MKKFNHGYPVIIGFFLTLLLIPISVMCFEKPDQDLDIKPLQISPECTIDLLRKKVPSVTRQVHEDYRKSIVTPGTNQEQLVKIAFSAMPEFVCKAVNKVVFVSKRNGDAAAFVQKKYPDLVIIIVPEDAARSDNFPTEDRLAFRGEDQDITDIYRQNSEPAERERKLKDYVEERLNKVWSKAIKTIIHEATHSAGYLLESLKEDYIADTYCEGISIPGIDTLIGKSIPDVWIPNTTNEGKKIRDKTGLQEGLYKEWCRMNKAFVEAKLSTDYDSGIKPDDTAPPIKGFFSRYGQQDHAEDMAEIASLIQFSNFIATGGLTIGNLQHLDSDAFNVLAETNATWIVEWSDFANVRLTHEYFNVCKEDLQGITENGVSPDFAAIYTKMNFLRDLGFITEEAYKTCIGDGKIGLQGSDMVTRNGFHRIDGDNEYRHDIDKIGHTIVHPDRDEKLFIIIGKGDLKDGNKTYKMDMWLRFNKTNGTNLPRGIYKLNWLWSPNDSRPCPPLFSSSDSPWTFYVNVEKAPSKSFCAVAGQILVTRSSKNFIEAGMIIQKVLKRVGGPPVQLPSARVVGGIPITSLAKGQIIPEVPNFRVYIRWER